jgi:hypothetical protein
MSLVTWPRCLNDLRRYYLDRTLSERAGISRTDLCALRAGRLAAPRTPAQRHALWLMWRDKCSPTEA